MHILSGSSHPMKSSHVHCLLCRLIFLLFSSSSPPSGGYTSQNDYDCAVQKIEVRHFIKHEMYNEDTTENDIAILKLDRSLIFNKYIQPACLPEEDYDYPVNKSRRGPSDDRTSCIVHWFPLKICFRMIDSFPRGPKMLLRHCHYSLYH